jgi:hypothetical protein
MKDTPALYQAVHVYRFRSLRENNKCVSTTNTVACTFVFEKLKLSSRKSNWKKYWLFRELREAFIHIFSKLYGNREISSKQLVLAYVRNSWKSVHSS